MNIQKFLEKECKKSIENIRLPELIVFISKIETQIYQQIKLGITYKDSEFRRLKNSRNNLYKILLRKLIERFDLKEQDLLDIDKNIYNSQYLKNQIEIE